ncbi:hypothetical protein LTR08_005020 [Meristemomyces frigidus]|nr:hypothetical protein LTR08_005020 [Meristemomyces frigidus]
MGSGSSKPAPHVFTADAPVSFSQSVLDALQRNPETDSTRALTTEHKLQTRVNAELSRIRDAQSQALADLTSALTTHPPAPDAPPPAAHGRDPHTLAAHLSSPFYQDHSASKPVAPVMDTPADSGRSHDSVEKELGDLRDKLAGRRQVAQVPEGVERARGLVVQCLRVKDRRPLDCWREVEAFRVEVGKVERAFVERVGR